MKTLGNLLWIICLLLLFGLTSSCKKELTFEDLDGTWKLDMANSTFTGNWSYGAYTWDFDISDAKLRVTKPENEELGFLDSGNYDFTVSGTTITISNIVYSYSLKEKTVYISEAQYVDGLVMRFSKE